MDDLSAPSDNTDLDVSTTSYGLVPKGTNVGDFLKDDGTWTTPGGGISQATQGAIEAETGEHTYAPPDLVKHSQGVAKAYCHITGSDGPNDVAYNITSTARNSTGDYTITIATDFSGVTWTPVCSHTHGADTDHIHCRRTSAGVSDTDSLDSTATREDANHGFLSVGDQ